MKLARRALAMAVFATRWTPTLEICFEMRISEVDGEEFDAVTNGGEDFGLDGVMLVYCWWDRRM